MRVGGGGPRSLRQTHTRRGGGTYNLLPYMLKILSSIYVSRHIKRGKSLFHFTKQYYAPPVLTPEGSTKLDESRTAFHKAANILENVMKEYSQIIFSSMQTYCCLLASNYVSDP